MSVAGSNWQSSYISSSTVIEHCSVFWNDIRTSNEYMLKQTYSIHKTTDSLRSGTHNLLFLFIDVTILVLSTPKE